MRNIYLRWERTIIVLMPRISSTHPNDPRQPFYNASGAPMNPLAKLTITRERLYRFPSIQMNNTFFWF